MSPMFTVTLWPFLSVPQGWSTVQATRTAARYDLWLISHLCVGTPSAPSQAPYSQASDYTQDRYGILTTCTKLHLYVFHYSHSSVSQSFCTLKCFGVFFFGLFCSYQNSTDWCTYSLQRRKANTSTNTIDRRTHCLKVQNRTFLTKCDYCILWTDLNVCLSWPHRNSIRLWSQKEEEKARRRSGPQEKEERQEKEKSKSNFFSVTNTKKKSNEVEKYLFLFCIVSRRCY